jgi:hypothetical protein
MTSTAIILCSVVLITTLLIVADYRIPDTPNMHWRRTAVFAADTLSMILIVGSFWWWLIRQLVAIDR